MKKICHITTGLNIGGAEMFLLNLAVSMKQKGVEQTVISLLAEGDLSERFVSENIQVIHLGINRYPWTWWLIFKLPFLLKRISPGIIQTWLYHADLIGGLAALFVNARLVWNVRQTDISAKHNKKEIVLIARIAGVLSKHLPDKIICCSERAKKSHVEIGYDESKFVVIPNGCDTSVYKPEPDRKKILRNDLNLDNDIVIGRIGRYDPQKDYKNFISAADMLCSKNQAIWFLMAGEYITDNNASLEKWISQTGCPGRFILLGKRDDLPDLYQAIDVMVSSSLGEGFPNVVAEAMACEVPCVVTDVGESSALVGEAGIVVPKGDAAKLAEACQQLIDMEYSRRDDLGKAARTRIKKLYSIERSTRKYLVLYEQLCDCK